MNNNIIKIGIGQIELSDTDWKKNFATVKDAYFKLVEQGCQFTIFPELWPSAMNLPEAVRHAENNENEIYPELLELSKKKKVFSHWGSMLWGEGGEIYNQAMISDADGRELIRYRKIHLFSLMGEDGYLSPGNRLPVADTPYGKIATAICYDLRFPELFRYYALAGARMIFVPAEWPHPRLLHWQRMIQARAIENQVYIIACNRVGKSEKYDFFGHSMVVDPWGEIIYEGPESADITPVSVDLSRLDEATDKLNSLGDVQNEIYRQILRIQE